MHAVGLTVPAACLYTRPLKSGTVNVSKRDRKSSAFPVGMGAGIAIGAAFGAAVGDVALAAAVGVALGLVFGMLLRVMKVMGDNGDA